MPERPRSHVIGEIAEVVMKERLPPEWVCRDLRPDYNIDFHVEIYEHGETTGIDFYVQLKGTEQKARSNREYLSHALPAKTLIKFQEVVDLPVFLLIADCKTRQLYWQFLQGFVLNDLRRKNWRRQSKVSVRIPITNLISDGNDFRKRVESARLVVKQLRGGIRQGIEAEKAFVHELDPRFTVSAVAIDGQLTNMIKPVLHPLEMTLSMSGEPSKLRRVVRDLFKKGRPTDVTSVTIRTDDSPLIDYLLANSTHLQMAVVRRMVIAFVAGEHRLQLDARLECGREEIRVCSTSPGPLKCDFRGSKRLATATLRLNPDAWRGMPVKELVLLAQLEKLCVSASDGVATALVISDEYAGNPLSLDLTTKNPFTKMAPQLDPYCKAARLARHLGINPILPAPLTNREARELDFAHWLLMDGTSRPINGFRLPCRFIASPTHFLGPEVPLNIAVIVASANVFGESTELPRRLMKLSGMVSRPTASEIAARFAAGETSVDAMWVGETTNSTMTACDVPEGWPSNQKLFKGDDAPTDRVREAS